MFHSSDIRSNPLRRNLPDTFPIHVVFIGKCLSEDKERCVVLAIEVLPFFSITIFVLLRIRAVCVVMHCVVLSVACEDTIRNQ
jgi:hypothetical protein